jgi:hypothetical protein
MLVINPPIMTLAERRCFGAYPNTSADYDAFDANRAWVEGVTRPVAPRPYQP